MAAGACLAMLGTGIGLAGQAQAARRAPAAGAAKQATLVSVSCVRPTWCMAVGDAFGAHNVHQDLAEIWNGTSWRLVAAPVGAGLGQVACSATWNCLAFAGPGQYSGRNTPTFRWNGRKWLKIAEPKEASSIPSCVSRTMCIVGNGYAQSVLSWNGKTWTNTQLCGGNRNAQCVTSTSCSSVSFCMAVGTIENEIYNFDADTSIWDGTKWSDLVPPDGYDEGADSALSFVSCAGQTCLMLGSEDYEWDNTTKTWQDVPSPMGLPGGIRALSCSSGTDCMVIDGGSANAWWHAGAWTNPQFAPAGQLAHFVAVSCKGGSCLAVGYGTTAGKTLPRAESWNGTAWQLITPKAPAS